MPLDPPKDAGAAAEEEKPDLQEHHPVSVHLANLLTTRVAALLGDRLTQGKGGGNQKNLVKMAARLASGLDAEVQAYEQMSLNMARVELQEEIDVQTQDCQLLQQDRRVTADTVKTCSTLVSKVKQLRDIRRSADQVSGTIAALEQEEAAVGEVMQLLQPINRSRLTSLLDESNSLIKEYNDLIISYDSQ